MNSIATIVQKEHLEVDETQHEEEILGIMPLARRYDRSG